VVNAPLQTCDFSLGGNLTTITGTYKGDYEVQNGTSLYLNGGTISGKVQVDATGRFLASGGSVGGNLVSLGGPTKMVGTKVGGYIKTTNALLGLGDGINVKGAVTITGGGPVCIDGPSAGRVQIGGDLHVNQLPASHTVDTICGANVSGDLDYSNNAQPVAIGVGSSCVGNTMGGGLTVQSNSDRVTVGAAGTGFGNSAKGSISVQSNTGGGTLTNNAATKSCTLQNDTPGIVGSQNTAKGTNTCNRTA
jgi:hypothetical protein